MQAACADRLTPTRRRRAALATPANTPRSTALRELGGGWQMLELTGFNDPPDLLGPCQVVVVSTGHPVLAAYISDGDRAVMCAATADRLGPLTHLWDVSGPCPGFR